MKLLLDHNLSFRLLKKLHDLYPDSVTVETAGLSRASDQEIWNFAKRGGYTILTQDIDFSEMAQLLGHPPKVVWLRCGNTSTDYIAARLKQHHAAIQKFTADPTSGCLEIF